MDKVHMGTYENRRTVGTAKTSRALNTLCRKLFSIAGYLS